MDSLSTWVPQASGLLPKWQLLVASMAFFNSLQNFITLNLTRRLYNGPAVAVTPLQARTFAIWTLTASVVRFYAAYNINNKLIYDITLFTYLFAFGHFASEILIFRTAKFGPVVSPVIVSTVSLVWMMLQYDFYVSR
ncbi:Erg28-like protein [Pterulicium gracile]|uniref:Erg28-like protein n=1 Tax=Pterulicium gracile TaxID=1884261 RepID=A0A5C3QRM6_9AGAR|nr:Erg28-like protein [Pterula gracilis]